jgi:hypothetical protein
MHPVDRVIDETIANHADGARQKKALSERQRLAPRRRVTRTLYGAVMKELATRGSKGMRPADEKIASLCENAVKGLLKALDIESSAKKDDE